MASNLKIKEHENYQRNCFWRNCIFPAGLVGLGMYSMTTVISNLTAVVVDTLAYTVVTGLVIVLLCFGGKKNLPELKPEE